jgi:PII-like signaling protein
MNMIDVTMVRVYVTESSHLLTKVVDCLKTTIKIRGLSVFRAISGYGDSGMHGATFVDLSLDLPLVIEFFDEQEKINLALEALSKIIKPEHIIFWNAKVNA